MAYLERDGDVGPCRPAVSDICDWSHVGPSDWQTRERSMRQERMCASRDRP
jgi:hypothetical protein